MRYTRKILLRHGMRGKGLLLFSVLSVLSFSAFAMLHFSSAQNSPDIIKAKQLREYFLPIEALAPVEEGKIVVKGEECFTVDGVNCVDNVLAPDPQLGYGQTFDGGKARKTTDGLFLSGNGSVSYFLEVKDRGVYQLRVKAYDGTDSLGNLTKNQYENLRNNPANNDELSGKDEAAVRTMQFDLSIGLEGGVLSNPKTVNISDTTEGGFASMDTPLLLPGRYEIKVNFVNYIGGLIYNGAGTKDGLNEDCTLQCDTGSYLECLTDPQNAEQKTCQMPSVDRNGDGLLDKTPIISEITLSKTTKTNDVIGLRIYANPENYSASDWYDRKLVRPGAPTPFVVDGYRGVLDQRTAYINAANVDDQGNFYTNIYVIAYNLNAGPATAEIFKRMVENWKFNKNIIEGLNDVEAQRAKDLLRRDTQRLEDLVTMREALDRYKRGNGKYPDLGSGTYDKGHVISSWGTWQSVLGNQLGIAMPVDPINKLAVDFYSSGSSIPENPRQYNCALDSEKANCVNICSRGEANVPLTGCGADQQCAGAEFCSVVPNGYDPYTGFNSITSKLVFREDPKFGVYTTTARRQQESGTDIPVETGYNTSGITETLTGGNEKFGNDAFVYQYSPGLDAKSYYLNYRLEFKGSCAAKDALGKCTCTANEGKTEILKTPCTTSIFSVGACPTGQCFIPEFGQCLESGSASVSLAGLAGGGYWEFEGTDATVEDLALNNDGAIIGGATRVADGRLGQTDQAIMLDGINGKVNFGDPADGSLDAGTGDLSLSAWIKTDDIATNYQSIIDKFSAEGYRLLLHNGKLWFQIRTAGTPSTIISPNSLLSNQWYFVTATYNRNTDIAKLYIDGVGVKSETFTVKIVDVTTPLSIGFAVNNSGYFKGIIDEVRFFKRILTLSEIAALYNSSGNKGNYSGLYCFAGSLIPSCGNGIVQPDAGEACEPFQEGTNSSFCDDSLGLGAHAWYNEANINPKCTSSCQIAGGGDTPEDYNQQRPNASCGGYCGDNEIQFEYGEECDGGATGVGSCSVSSITEQDACVKAGNIWTAGGQGGVGGDSEYSCYAPDIMVDGVNMGCKTKGGFCGDGSIQRSAGEVCDVGSYRSPLPERTVNQLFNPGFENGMQGWLSFASGATSALQESVTPTDGVSKNSLIDRTQSYTGRSSLKIVTESDASQISIAQQVYYPPKINSSDATTLKVTLAAKANANETDNTAKIKVSLFAYNSDGTLNTTAIVSAYMNYIGVNNTSLDTSVPEGRYVLYSKDFADISSTQTTELIVFTIENPGINTYYLDNVYLSSNFHLNYSCGTDTSNKLCQLKGGSCGDGVPQFENGEVCDNGVYNGINKISINASGVLDMDSDGAFSVSDNLSTTIDLPTTILAGGGEYDVDGDGKADGQILPDSINTTIKKAYSYCSQICSRPVCGDNKVGLKLKAGNVYVPELCDPSDPTDSQSGKCASTCTGKLLGGICTSSAQCQVGQCVDYTTGTKTCSLGVGETGCTSDADCGNGIVGLFCDVSTTICLPNIDFYLRSHLDPNGLPYSSDVSLHCPEIISYTKNNITQIQDKCTGLAFKQTDVTLFGDIKLTVNQAINECNIGGQNLYTLPTLKQLYSLVSAEKFVDSAGSDASNSYTPNNMINLCSQRGDGIGSGGAGDDGCSEFASPVNNESGNLELLTDAQADPYLYWTQTPYIGGTCSNATSKICTVDNDCPNADGSVTLNSCVKTGKVCSNNPTFTCTADTNCGAGNKCGYPMACNNNPARICNIDSDCGSGNLCNQALYYAVNFKTGAVEVYGENAQMGARCVRFPKCGNWVIEEGEDFDYNKSAPNDVNQYVVPSNFCPANNTASYITETCKITCTPNTP